MALILKQENKGASFPRLEPGVYPAICYGVVDIGEQYNKRFGKTARQVVLLWELPTEKVEIDGEDVSRVISKTYNMSLNEKATLRQTLKSWRGRDFTAEELQGFDLLNILGAHCLLNITNNETNDGKVTQILTPLRRSQKECKNQHKHYNHLVLILILIRWSAWSRCRNGSPKGSKHQTPIRCG